MKKTTELRVCASCEWIFRKRMFDVECPMCKFGSYGARYVYGDKCYSYEKTQKPHLAKKIAELRFNVYLKNKKQLDTTQQS